MAFKRLPPIEYVRQCLRYDPNTGFIYWLKRPLWMFPDKRAWSSFNTRMAGKRGFTALSTGGLCGTLCKQRYLAHRVAYYLHTGTEPQGEIDHINGDWKDNRIANLRVVQHRDNARNRAKNKTHLDGHFGVAQISENRWHATMRVDGKRVFLGNYIDDSRSS